MATATKEKIDPKTGEVTEETTTNTAVATTGGTDLSVLPDDGYGEYLGAGYENQTSEDVGIPFFEILQPGSPEAQGEDGPRPGQIINKTTGQAISGKDGLAFVPVLTEHKLVEWVPRDNGGGLVGSHDIDSPLARKVRAEQPLGTYKHPDNGNDLVETFYVWGLHIDAEGNPSPGIIAFSSTKIGPYKNWQYMARSIVIELPGGRKQTNLPLFSHIYRLTTKFVEKNNYKWYNWVPGFAGADAKESRIHPKSDLFATALALREALQAGTVKADTNSLKREEGEATPTASASKDQEAAPY